MSAEPKNRSLARRFSGCPDDRLWPGAGSHERQLSGHPTWLSAVGRPVRAPGCHWPTRSGH